MKKIILAFIFLLTVFTSRAGWTNLNTGINDNLTGVVFWGNKGLVAGGHGIYYTTNGGSGPSSWTRFNISTNHNDSILYNRSKFRHAYADPSNGNNKAVVCGIDTVLNRPVVMVMDFTAFTYTVAYTGSQNTGGFNKITFAATDNNYYFVGDAGLMAKMPNTFTSFTSIATPFTIDLNFISFNFNAYCIGANGNMINGYISGASYTFTSTASPLNNFKDGYSLGLNSSYCAGSGYFKWTSGSLSTLSDYDFGPLNASCMLNAFNFTFVGTDHGIFRSNTALNVLEWQPTSLNYNIRNFWRVPSSVQLYACGYNGIVLVSTDYGGFAKPYVRLTASGGCANALTPVSAVVGTSGNCKWYVDNVLISSSCNSSFVYNYTSVGQHTVQLNADNGPGLYDTSIQVITIVDPGINKLVSVNKSVLCKQEPLVITVASSEPNVFYTLRQFGNSTNFGDSPLGTSSALTFTSSALSVAGNYYLQARSNVVTCNKSFTDTIKIRVEKTQAAFHVSALNATPNESVTCFEHCTDAQNYQWTFSAGSTPAASGIQTPTVSFITPGSTQVKLVAWSNYGCYDSIQKAGPTIYIEPAVDDSCWTLVNNGTDLPWPGYYTPDISRLTPSRNGYLISGFYNTEAFSSRYGDSLRLPAGQRGAYLAKYNKSGVLKWVAYSTTTSLVRESVTSSAEDRNGNVYACGYGTNITDNTGTRYNSSETAFIYKMDSLGKLIWRLEFNSARINPQFITLDPAGDLYVSATSNFLSTAMKLNGVFSYSVITTQTPANHHILKFNTSGALIWANAMNLAGVNGYGIQSLTFDKYHNIYVSGVYEQSADFYDAPGSTTKQTLPGLVANYGGRLFLAKYNSMGTLQWKLRSITQNALNDLTKPYSAATDSTGNTYISGTNDCDGTGTIHTFENTDGSTTTTTAGRYFIAKVNSSGICKWIQSSSYSYYGLGHAVYESGNEVGVLGQIANNYTSGPLFLTNTFSSADNNTIPVTIGRFDYFVAIYDTSGNIKRVVVNADNSSGGVVEMGFTGFYKLSGGHYRISRNIQSTIPFYPYINFGDLIGQTNGLDGSTTTFSENCGIVYTSSSVSCVTPSLTVNNPTICAGSTATLTAAGASSYSWFPAPGLSVNSGSMVTVTPTAVTVYTVLASAGSCIALAYPNVQVNASPTISISSSSVCSGQTATLSSSGASSYTWNPGSITGPTYTVIANVSPSTYTVTGSSSGCSAAITTTLSGLPVPALVVSASPTVICLGEQVILNASGASTYTWTGGILNATPFSPTVTTLFTVTGSLNTCTNTATQLISVYNCTGIEENNLQKYISVYPNPAQNMVFIDGLISEGLEVRLINQLGQTMHCNYDQGRISLMELAKGLYYIMIYKDNDLYYQAKLFKE